MRPAVLALLLGVALTPRPAAGADSREKCRTRRLQVCRNENDSQVCKLFAAEHDETHSTIEQFLKALGRYDPATRETFICARLIGRRRINIDSDIPVLHLRGAPISFDASEGYWKITSDHPSLKKLSKQIERLIEQQKKCSKLLISVPKVRVRLEIAGVITAVDADYYSNGTLRRYTIEVAGVQLERLRVVHPRKPTIESHINELKALESAAIEKILGTGIAK